MAVDPFRHPIPSHEQLMHLKRRCFCDIFGLMSGRAREMCFDEVYRNFYTLTICKVVSPSDYYDGVVSDAIAWWRWHVFYRLPLDGSMDAAAERTYRDRVRQVCSAANFSEAHFGHPLAARLQAAWSAEILPAARERRVAMLGLPDDIFVHVLAQL